MNRMEKTMEKTEHSLNRGVHAQRVFFSVSDWVQACFRPLMVSVVNFKKKERRNRKEKGKGKQRKRKSKAGWNLRFWLFFVGCASQTEDVFHFLSFSYVCPFFPWFLVFSLVFVCFPFSRLTLSSTRRFEV